MRVLDKNGLTRFWSKIKSTFLNISGGIINGNLVVKGTCSVQTLTTESIVGGYSSDEKVFAANGNITDVPKYIKIEDFDITSTVATLLVNNNNVDGTRLGNLNTFLKNYITEVSNGNGYYGTAYGKLFVKDSDGNTSELFMYKAHLLGEMITYNSYPYYAIIEFISLNMNNNIRIQYAYRANTVRQSLVALNTLNN